MGLPIWFELNFAFKMLNGFLITDSISLLVVSIFTFPISSCFNLGILCFQEFLCVFFKLFDSLAYNPSQLSHMILCVSLVCHNAFFIYEFSFLNLLYFIFLSKSSERFVYFIFSKSQTLSFVDPFYCFSSLYFINFCSDVYNLLPFACFGLVSSSFSSFLR